MGDCLFCGRDGKFSVDVATGLWRCFTCGAGTAAGGGNGLVFTRLVHEYAVAALRAHPGTFAASVAADRGLADPGTVAAWGVAPAAGGTWLVPGYGPDGCLDQVYRRTRVQDKGEWSWRLLPTPGIWPDGKVHSLHLPSGDFDPHRPDVVVCEGPWDAMVLWEVMRSLPGAHGNVNVVAVPGCNVWRDDWTQMCRGKHVVLLYDSDYPREYVPGKVSRAGYDGMQRVAKRLSGAAASVRYVRWGPDGFDPDRPSGWDVRDHLRSGPDRATMLEDLLSKVEGAPREWFNPSVPMSNGHAARSSEAIACSTLAECEAAWRNALEWRQDLSDALAVLLAVCASTQQSGNQLFLDLIGSPGSAKTTLCKGLLVSSMCIHLENATKLISGYKKPGDDGADCSFIARANGKTWITCEFDVMASSPQYRDLMGKVRRIFDGETSATYGNSDEDRIYAALRTPWIRAGTHKMVDHDQSQLGDRFLRFYIGDPTDADRRTITMRAIRAERSALVETANATSGSVVDPDTRLAHCLTGGYVDWLRANVEEKLSILDVPESAEEYCADLAELCADLRARPAWEDPRKSPAEATDGKELPTRLARQNIRLASCLAVVMNRASVDRDVLRIVRKVALDTASGHSLNIVQWLCRPNPKADNRPYQECGGLMDGILSSWSGMPKERLSKYMLFLSKINVVEWREIRQSLGSWVLTDRVYELYSRIMGAS